MYTFFIYFFNEMFTSNLYDFKSSKSFKFFKIPVKDVCMVKGTGSLYHKLEDNELVVY